MRLKAVFGVILIVVLLIPSITTAAAEQRPNIVLMLADDLGYGDLSCYGSTQTSTPHLDGLAAGGLRFTDFYAGSGVCSPSRACFMTGRFSVRVGVYSWIHTSHNMHLRVEETTIAELLKEAGYSTAHLGKWHLGYDLEDGSGNGPDPGDHGFDYWMATGNNASPSHRNPNNFVKNGVAMGELKGYSSQIVVDEAIGWLDNHRDKDKPFFLNLWFHEPHAKVAAPPEYAKRHAGTRNPEYYGCIENMDNAVGRILVKLETMGVTEDTLVLFTSDNGSYMQGSNGSLQGRKTTLWEGGIREPAMVRWPGRVTPGSVSDAPSGIVDILPTVCDAAGITRHTALSLDGISLVPLFKGGEIARKRPLYWFYNPSRPVCVIRDGNWCLIADPDLPLSRDNMFKESYIGDIKAAKLVNFRMFNLKKDPGQTTELSGQHPEVFDEMKKKMRVLHADVMAEAYDWRKVEAR